MRAVRIVPKPTPNKIGALHETRIMANRTVIDTLNSLLAAEYSNPLGRLRETGVFVSLGSAADRAAVNRLLSEIDTHEKKLADAILARRGTPVTRRIDISTGGFHYLTIESVMPTIIKSVRTLIGAYESAGATGDAGADSLIGTHLANYQKIAETFERMHAHLVSSK